MATRLSAQENHHTPKRNASSNFDSVPMSLNQMEKLAAIGQLSSSVAHEMRNLLGMIRNAAFNIDRTLHSTEAPIQNNLDIINRSVNRAREFIDNLLDLSRIPQGTMEVIEIQAVVDSLLNLFSKELEWRRIKLIRNYKPTCLFQLDRNALQECLLNLILNAIQSMEPGGTIAVSIEPWKHGVQISVSDTGCGISIDKLEKIFDRFYTTKKNGQGTGLGLTIARSLARDLGGDITVQSRMNAGSTFTICLPHLLKVAEHGESSEKSLA